MAKNNTVVKYKVINTNIDKKFIDKDLDLQKVKSKSRPTTKTRVKAPAWFVAFEKRNNQRFDRLENRIDNLVVKNNLKE